jgi:hypothetical protein
MIEFDAQHLVLLVLLVLFYMLPTDSLPRRSRDRDDWS